MNIRLNWINWFGNTFKEFLSEIKSKLQYEIVDIFECPQKGFLKGIIKLSSRHTMEKRISEIIIDKNLIEFLDKKTIRTLTYMATIESMKPDYSILKHELGTEVDEHILEIKSRNNKMTYKKSAMEITRDKELLTKFNPIDANRIGYLAGVKETVNEFQLKSNKNQT